MATFTADEIKARTSAAKVANWTDTKILFEQQTAEAVLMSFDMDSSMSGYTEAYQGALIILFDFLAENPTGAKVMRQGKQSTHFNDLPPLVQKMLKRYIDGEGGTLMPAKLERMDMGRR